MAVSAVVPSIAKLQAHGIVLKEPLLLAKTSHVPAQRFFLHIQLVQCPLNMH